MNIPPPWIPPPPPPPPERLRAPEPPPAAEPRTLRQRIREFLNIPLKADWVAIRDALHPGTLLGGIGTPFDLLDIFKASVFQLVFRVFKVFLLLGFSVAMGAWALTWTDVEWNDFEDWPTPSRILDNTGTEELVLSPIIGAAMYAFSFVACLRGFLIVPFALIGFLIQIHWMVRAMSEEDEEPWLLPAVVPIVAWQVFVAWGWDEYGNMLMPLAFLASFTVCWVMFFVVRGWMLRRDIGFLELIDTTRQRFDPAFHRWQRPAAAPAPTASPVSLPAPVPAPVVVPAVAPAPASAPQDDPPAPRPP